MKPYLRGRSLDAHSEERPTRAGMALAALATAAVLLAPCKAFGWAATFGENAFSEDVASARILILPAGTDAAGIERASGAAAALRAAAGRLGAEIVGAEAGPEEINGLPDAEIVSALEGRGADLIVVVRVFPGPPAPSAVVSVFRPDGRSAGGYMIQRGRRLSPRQGSQVGRGVRTRTVEAVAAALDGAGPRPRGHPGLRFTAYTDFTGCLWPTRILDARLIDHATERRYFGSDIYRVLQHDDLARKYDRRDWVLTRTTKGGGWAAASGGLLFFTGLALEVHGLMRPFPEDSEIFDVCRQYDDGQAADECRTDRIVEAIRPQMIVGRALRRTGFWVTVGGGTTWWLSRRFSSHPVSPRELQGLVARRNEDVRLGTFQDRPDPTEDEPVTGPSSRLEPPPRESNQLLQIGLEVGPEIVLLSVRWSL